MILQLVYDNNDAGNGTEFFVQGTIRPKFDSFGVHTWDLSGLFNDVTAEAYLVVNDEASRLEISSDFVSTLGGICKISSDFNFICNIFDGESSLSVEAALYAHKQGIGMLMDISGDLRFVKTNELIQWLLKLLGLPSDDAQFDMKISLELLSIEDKFATKGSLSLGNTRLTTCKASLNCDDNQFCMPGLEICLPKQSLAFPCFQNDEVCLVSSSFLLPAFIKRTTQHFLFKSGRCLGVCSLDGDSYQDLALANAAGEFLLYLSEEFLAIIKDALQTLCGDGIQMAEVVINQIISDVLGGTLFEQIGEWNVTSILKDEVKTIVSSIQAATSGVLLAVSVRMTL